MRRFVWRLILVMAAVLALAGQALAVSQTVSTDGTLQSSSSASYQRLEKTWDSPNGYKVLGIHLQFQGRPAYSGATYTNDYLYLYYRKCATCGWSYYDNWSSSLTRDFWVDLGAQSATGIKVLLYTRSGLTTQTAWADAPEVTVDAPPFTPGQPSLPDDTSAGTWQQTITWSAMGNPVGTTFELWRRTYNPAGAQVADERIYAGTGTTFTTTDQVPGRYYRYRVRAIWSGNTGDFSPETAYWTVSSPSTITSGVGSVTVSWAEVYPNVTYRVWWKQDSVGWASVTTANATYTFTGLSPASRYYFAIGAVLPEGGSEWRAGDSTTAYSPLYPAPGGVKVEGTTQTETTVRWYRGSVPASAAIRVIRNGSPVWQGTPAYSREYDPDWGWQYVARFTDSGLVAGTGYRYDVCAVNVLGQCGAAVTATMATVPPAPATPTGTVGSLGWAPVGRGWAVVNWLPVQGATGYKVWVFDGYTYRAFDAGATTSWDTRVQRIYPTEATMNAYGTDSTTRDLLSHNQSGLDLRDDPSNLYRVTAGSAYNTARNYWFRVSAYNEFGESPQSQPWTPALPDRTDPNPPAGVTVQINDGATQTGGSRVQVTVTASDDKSGLTTVQLSNDNTSWTTVATMSGLSDSETVEWNLASATSYGVKTVYARVQDAAGNWSATGSAQIMYLLTDVTGPQVTLQINGGAAATDSTNVMLTIQARDDQTAPSALKMRFSNEGTTWSPWENYQPAKPWTLAAGEGRKTVWVQVQDTAGNIGGTTASIFHLPSLTPVTDPASFWSDTGAPGRFDTGNGIVDVQFVRVAEVTVRWNLAAVSGARTVRYGFSPQPFGAWETLTGSRAILLPPGQGIVTLYAQLDNGRTYLIRFLSDATPPEVRVSWLGGATITAAGGRASIVLEAQDNLARSEDLQVSVGGGPWAKWAPEIPVTLSGAGPVTVAIRVRDPAGNVTLRTLTIHVLQ